MILYALLIAATRLVLLAHHPSDVVAGALVGIIGAMGCATGSPPAAFRLRSGPTAPSCR